MLLGSVNFDTTYAPFLRGEVWVEALAWIRQNAATASPGVHALRGRDMFVNVHGYSTGSASEARFECHRRYVDLQYCIRGGETILWRPCAEPPREDEYDVANDACYRPVAGEWSALVLSPGLFAVFFPQDEHAPKIANGIHKDIWKLVVKIDRALL
jgi:YhcH/YjgK/YiaL family protein